MKEDTLFVNKKTRLVYSIYKILSSGNIILECDDDGSLQNDDNPLGDGSLKDILEEFEVWYPGIVTITRTGK